MEFLPVKKDGAKVYAGFWKRFGALIVDILVFIPFFYLFNYLQSTTITIAMITVFISRAFDLAYTVYFHNKFGATLGKMAMGIKVTLPNGSSIGLKQAFLRSSVDIAIGIFAVIGLEIAISNVDPEQYLAASFLEKDKMLLLPKWCDIALYSAIIWHWGEIIVLLFNKRKRALHDFIAGTVVIHKKFAI